MQTIKKATSSPVAPLKCENYTLTNVGKQLDFELQTLINSLLTHVCILIVVIGGGRL